MFPSLYVTTTRVLSAVLSNARRTSSAGPGLGSSGRPFRSHWCASTYSNLYVWSGEPTACVLSEVPLKVKRTSRAGLRLGSSGRPFRSHWCASVARRHNCPTCISGQGNPPSDAVPQRSDRADIVRQQADISITVHNSHLRFE